MTNLVLHKGDNFRFVEDGTVDFVLTDPPFNISRKTNFASYEKNTIHSYQFDDASGEEWDTYSHAEFLDHLAQWASEWERVLRKGGSFAIFCADSYVSHLMDKLRDSGLTPRRLITWRKNNAVPVNRQYMPMSANEYIVVGVKDGKSITFNSDVSIENQTLEDKLIEATIVADKVSTIVYAATRKAVMQLPSVSLLDSTHLDEVASIVEGVLESVKADAAVKTKAMYKVLKSGNLGLQACVPNYVQNPLKGGSRIHPTEKPVELLQYLVALYSKRGDVVLDGFGGSGSSAEAALSLGRSAIAVEREEKFYESMEARLSPQAQRIQVV